MKPKLICPVMFVLPTIIAECFCYSKNISHHSAGNGELRILIKLQLTHLSSVIIFDNTDNTMKNTVISPNFLMWKFCGKAQFPHSETMRKLCLSTKFPHQEVR